MQGEIRKKDYKEEKVERKTKTSNEIGNKRK